MPLESPNLDDRDFEQLVAEARRRVARDCPEWSDLGPSDPGMVLLELFAHLTETMIYRLNRVPEKAYVEFLRLIGVKLQPPSAARVKLRFSRTGDGTGPIEIPRGTRVTVGRAGGEGEPPVFVTSRTATLAAGESTIGVLAHGCEMVEAELAGKGSGMPGFWVTARRPPIVATTGEPMDLVVGVEALPEELEEGMAALRHGEKIFRVWREVANFSQCGPEDCVFVADRMTGTITFAPAVRMRSHGQLDERPRALGAIPENGREIRLWYRRGGGAEGNQPAGALTTLKDRIAGLAVTNPERAVGGAPAESLENALIRGPQQLHSLKRAVTARDFELLALASSRAVARARAFTRAQVWKAAAPGTVEILLVPNLPGTAAAGWRVTAEMLHEHESEPVRGQIRQALDARRPLGTTCLVNWARYKSVGVRARVVVYREEDPEAVRKRIEDRLYRTINPLPGEHGQAPGWRFGHTLRASLVYDAILDEPGVNYVDGKVLFVLDEVPDREVRCLAADAFQPRTWYAGCGGVIFRSLNDGDVWEAAGRFGEVQVTALAVHPGRAGRLAAASRLAGREGSRLHLSADCGETWDAAAQTGFEVEQMAWVLRGGEEILLLATDVGLFELAMRPGSSPVQVLVDPDQPRRGFYAVTTATDVRGQVSVALAAQETGGVYLSSEGGRTRTFRHVGLAQEDVRVLAVQYDGPRSFLWAGAAAGGRDPGKGCWRWELRGTSDPPEGWQPFGGKWQGGSCHGLAFSGAAVLAATHSAGILRLDGRRRDAEWVASEIASGLAMRDRGRFHPLHAVAAAPGAERILTAGGAGVFRSADGVVYEGCSSREFSDHVALPETWLFCSAEHQIEVVSEDEVRGD